MNMNIMREYYDDMLDELYGTIDVCGIECSASLTLYRMDRIAYEVGMSDYESVLREAHEEDGSYADLFGDEEE
jgi:putative NADPH-quinone reductase